MYSATLFLTSALEGGEGSASRPGLTLSPGKTRYPLYKRLGGHKGRSGQVRKISPPPGFDLRTVQPVGSRYTDYATRPRCCHRKDSEKGSSTFLRNGPVRRKLLPLSSGQWRCRQHAVLRNSLTYLRNYT
jgi:hypothetical protein